MTKLKDPNNMHCNADPGICRGESYCACQCDKCKAAYEASAPYYAAKQASLPKEVDIEKRMIQRLKRPFSFELTVTTDLGRRPSFRISDGSDESDGPWHKMTEWGRNTINAISALLNDNGFTRQHEKTHAAYDLKTIFFSILNTLHATVKVEAGIVYVEFPDGTKWDFTVPEKKT